MERKQQRPGAASPRRRKKKMKLRYGRIALLAIVSALAMGSVGYAISNTLVSRPDAIGSSTVSIVSGRDLASVLTARADNLIAEKNQEKAAQEQRRQEEIRVQQMAASSSSQASSSQAATPPANEASSSSSSAPAQNGASSAASSAAASSQASSSQPAATFDPNSLGASGAANIPQWKAINADVRGWIKVPNTNISYPVVVGPDNNYYANLGYYKEQSRDGVIWADSGTKFGKKADISRNTVLYGHNWTNYSANPRIGNANDRMFAQLTAFHHLNFAQKTPYIQYSTEDESMVFKVFAVFYTEVDFNYISSDPEDPNFLYIIQEAQRRSRFTYDVDVNTTDKILTLSTCTRAYGPSDRQRFVVMARLLRDGEEITPVTITDNPNHKKPTL